MKSNLKTTVSLETISTDGLSEFGEWLKAEREKLKENKDSVRSKELFAANMILGEFLYEKAKGERENE